MWRSGLRVLRRDKNINTSAKQDEAEQRGSSRKARETSTLRHAEQSIHLFAAGSVVPDSRLPACLLPACLLPGKFFVVVSLDPDADHARLVHDLLDDFTVLADDFA